MRMRFRGQFPYKGHRERKRPDESDLEEQGVAEGFGRDDDDYHLLDVGPTRWYRFKDGRFFTFNVYPGEEKQAERDGYSRTQAEARQKSDQGTNGQDVAGEFKGELDSKDRFTKDTVQKMFGKLSPDAKGVAEGIGDEDGENKDYALALAQYGMKVLQGMEKICQQIDALPEPKKSKYLNTLTDVEFAQSGDLVQYVIDTLGLKIDDFMEFQDAWEEEGGEPFYIWIHEWLEGHWDEFVAPWKKFTMKVLQGRGLGPTLHEAGVVEGIETKIRAKNQAVVKKLQGKEVKEDITQEDIITKLKARLGDYLSDLGQQIKKDPALKDKLADKPRDTMGPSVKTVTTDDGQTISIHGNEDDGFRISIKNKPATAKFKTVDEAALACTMFNARRKNPRINTDYVDEA